MTPTVSVLLTVVAIQTIAIVALLIHRVRLARAQLALRESEERFRLMADGAPMILWTARPDATLDFLNRTCMEFTGKQLDQLLDNGWLSVVHPEDLDQCIRSYTPAFEARRPFVFEYRIRRADGVYRWILDSCVPRYDANGSYTGYIGCAMDITERRDAEERVRESQAALEVSHREIHHLAGRLIEAQDAERARIARDLHDDVSQQLAGMSIAFSQLKQRLGESRVSKYLQDDLQVLQQRATALAQNVRHLSHDLHPTVLRHAGLVAALTTYCGELQRTHGTVLTCTATGDFASIAPEAALCLYRIAQESLRNVIAHANASRAYVQLLHTGDNAEMTIADDARDSTLPIPASGAKGWGS